MEYFLKFQKKCTDRRQPDAVCSAAPIQRCPAGYSLRFLCIPDSRLQKLLFLCQKNGIRWIIFRRLFTSRSWLWVFFMELLTAPRDFSIPLVSPPISTVIPLIRLAMCHHLLKMSIKSTRISPGKKKASAYMTNAFRNHYFKLPSPPIRAVSSSIRSTGNGGSHNGFMAIAMSFIGLSSAATRLDDSFPQIRHRWIMAHSPFFLTHTATGSIIPPHSASLSPGSLSKCWLLRQFGQWFLCPDPAPSGTTGRPHTLQVNRSVQACFL